MKSNITDSPLRLYSPSQFPTIWQDPEGRTIHGYQNLTDQHHADGWRDYMAPTYDPSTQRLGELVYDEESDTVTRQVIAKTPDELEAERLAQIPSEIKPSQGKIQLHRLGLLDAVNTMIENSNDSELKIFWEYALTWELQNSYIQSMANLLGMTDADVEGFFVDASQIS
jgi:hypothetical protein